jgi:WD40 repeat protein
MLWRLDSPRGPQLVSPLTPLVTGADATALDPAGPILATADNGGVIRLWNILPSGQPTLLTTLSGTTAPQVTLAFSPDGDILASADSGGNTHLWDRADIHAPVTMGDFATPQGSTLIGLSLPVKGASDRIAETVSGTDTFNTWDIDSNTLIGRVCASSGDPITTAQWNQYVPGQPYTPPCAAGG